MALANVALVTGENSSAGAGPMFADLLSFDGDAAYPTGGTAGFQASFRTAIGGKTREVVSVIGQDCGGFVPVYDKTNDKLKVFKQSGADGALAEVANNADLHASAFHVLVLSR